MNNCVFTRRVSTQAKWLTVLTVLPLYLFGSSWIGNAFIKLIVLTFSLHLRVETLNAYLNLFVDLGMLLYVAWIFKDSLKEQWIDFKMEWKENLLYGALIGVGLIYAVGFIGGMITLLLGGNESSVNQSLISSITAVHPVVMALSTVCLAPLLEEIIFRGLLFGWLYEVNGKFAHVASAFLFGFVHVMLAVLSGNVTEWIQIFSYFFMGMVLSYLYEKRNNIFVPMLTHGMNNLISMLIMLFS